MKRWPQLEVSSERAFVAAAALLFAVMVLLNYGPVFLGKVPLPGHLVTQFPIWSEFKSRDAWQPVADIGDTIDYFYPFNAFSAQQVRQGTIPLWNPYIMSGMPFQAEPQTAMFYPLHAVYYLFSTPTAWSLALILRMTLCALFMTLLVRSIGATRTGAIVSGIAFAFGGFVVAWQGAVMGDAVIWLPLVCYSVHRLRVHPSRRSLCLAAFAFAMPVLAGHPETAIHVVLTGIGTALFLWLFPSESNHRFDPRFLAFVSLAGVLAVGLSAVQLLPTLDWVRQSGRNMNELWGQGVPLHQALGFISRDALRGPNSAGIPVPNAMGYVGMLTLLAAALAALHRSRRHVVWLGFLLLIGVSATFGFQPVQWFISHAPIIKGLKNERLFLLVDFALAALAGLGISVLQEEQANRSMPRRVLPWLLAAAAFTAAMFAVHELQLATQFKVEVMRRPSFSRSLLLAGMIVVVWKLIRLQRARLFPLVACTLVVFDLGTFAYGYTGFTWRDELFPPAPVFDFLKQKNSTDAFRVVSIGVTHTANASIAYGVQSVGGFEAAVPPALQRFLLDVSEGWADNLSLVGKKLAAVSDRRLDMLNVKYVVTASEQEFETFSQHPERFSAVFKNGRAAVFENKTALPRAFLVGAAGIRLIQGDAGQLEAVKDTAFDPLRTVVIDSLPKELVELSSEADFRSSVEIAESDVNGYRFKVEASAPAILIVSQNFYPGWKATVNGLSASVFPADHALTGIAIPAGNHDVRFEFQPPSFKVGLWLSIISVILLAGLLGPVRLAK